MVEDFFLVYFYHSGATSLLIQDERKGIKHLGKFFKTWLPLSTKYALKQVPLSNYHITFLLLIEL